MTKLTETQTLILSRAAKQADRIALPLPDRLRGGAANNVIVPLIKLGLLDEVDADIRNGEPTWRETGGGHGVTLVITDAGIEAITPSPDHIADVGKKVPRSGTKLALLVEMLSSDGGTTMAEIATATGWKTNTVRGAITNITKRYPHLVVTSDKPDSDMPRVYRISK